MIKMIEKVLDERVRPQLLLHGGGIESISCEEGVYTFRLLGQCAACPSAYLTTEELIRAELMEHIPELKDVVLHQVVSEDLLLQAKSFLNHEK